ncbi:GTPase [Chryseobacterium balustinum]|uniref:G domain-containing protein n=1 Tax=Chryseobacterium balustinum TaxID=246 RepID=A0ABY1LBJ1_9FLAO|nr:GTPase [Chryseobacterium balustinum]AZB32091.1 hypothetical protein EB354_22690 [Chryseobacterium balustinum]SKB94399.1 hypothetical protein SAMN05421800_11590 [Chryseobacterium balustinum]
MEESKNIYKTILSKILEINSEISLPENVNKDIAENLHNSSNQIKEILKNLESEINNLENLSEWEHYTISFIGETNAGKSTIIEALRIQYEEEEKKNAYTKNQELLFEEKNLLQRLQDEEELFNIDKISIDKNKTCELNITLQKADEAKKSLWFKVRNFLQKDYQPNKDKILNLKRDIEYNFGRNFNDLPWVTKDRNRLKTIKHQIIYDGEIIGTGKLDYTQISKTFFIKIKDELVKIIDVPGIEGDESKYEEEIKNAVSKSHCVFYITTSTKKLESGTLSKVKKYIKDQADVFAVVNMRLNSFKEEYFNLSFEEIYKNKLEAVESIWQQLKEELNDNFIKVVPINGHWGFLSLSKYLEKEGEKQKLSSDKLKLMKVFQDENTIYAKSNFKSFEKMIFETVNQKEEKIRKINIQKVNTLLGNIINNLQFNLDTFLRPDYLDNIKEQADNSKREVHSTYNDYLRELENIRKRILNDFKRDSFKAIDSFIQQNDINENIYNIGIKRILTEQCNLLQENIESGFKESVEKVNKQIHKSLSIFLDRLDTLNNMNNASFYDLNINVEFSFLKNDFLKLTESLFSIGGLAWTGAELGALIGTVSFPGVGTVSGAIIGAVVGGIIGALSAVFKFFQSTEKKKSKILMNINEQLEEQSKDIDKQLKTEFDGVSKLIKKDFIDSSLNLINNLFEMYQIRRDKISKTITELETTKIKD